MTSNFRYFSVLFIVSIFLFVGVGGAVGQVTNPEMVTWGTSWMAHCLDPAFAYYGVELSTVNSCYDPLVAYAEDGSFEPRISTAVPNLDNGFLSEDGTTYRFPIREGVKFHNGDELTVEDVEYSFERAMVLDPSGGPVWMILTALLNVSSTRQGGEFQVTFEDIDNAVEIDGNSVVFNLKKPYPPFLDVIAGSWSVIVNKSWVIENGGWPGTEETWKDYNNLKKEEATLFESEMGTGPFKLVRWEKGEEIVMEKFDGYFREPAKVERARIKIVGEWSTRKLLFQQGQIDIISAPKDMYPQLEDIEGVEIVNKLTPSVFGLVFNQDIETKGNEYIGSGKLDGKGIPPNFFTDLDVRKAFNYAFNWEVFIREVWKGDAVKLRGPIPKGVRYYNPDQEVYELDLEKAREHLKKAWGGEVWEQGFSFTVPYIEGKNDQQAEIEILAENLRRINPKFKIEARAAIQSKVTAEEERGIMPIVVSDFTADFMDPSNTVPMFMESNQGAASKASISGYDELVREGSTSIDPERRKEIYYKLQDLAYEDAIAIFTVQQEFGHVQRGWLEGWYAYPPQWPMVPYFYPLYKEAE